MVDRSHIIEVVDRYCEYMTTKNKNKWLDLFAENAVHEDPVGKVMNAGLEKISAFWDLIQPANIDLSLVEPAIVCGNEAIVLMRAIVGPDDARRETGRIVDQFIFNEDGKIIALRAFYNR